MTPADKIKELQKKIEIEQRAISTCSHKWDNPFYNPEDYQEPVFSHYEGRGSDPNPVYNYYTKQKDRWSRKCSICGKIEHTYKKEPVISSYAPKF